MSSTTSHQVRSAIEEFSSDQILRSINIVFDADAPDRIAHFFPTTKTIGLLRRLLTDTNSSGRFVVAPYGSGKSLLASFYQQVIENREEAISVLRPVIDRIQDIDEDLFRVIEDRTRPDDMFRQSGLVIPLTGYIPNLPEALHSGLHASLIRLGKEEIAEEVAHFECGTMDEVIDLLTHIREKHSGGDKFDHLDVLWDEFGRHLEELTVRGEAHRLNELQLMSEFAVRSRRFRMQLVLFLHQSLMHYATNVPQSVIHEWKKVEGRFETHQFVDDSKEIIALAARVIESRHHDRLPPPDYVEEQLAKLRDVGLFRDFGDEELWDLIKKAWPVLPAALYALPRVSARVAQNERTLFSFIFDLPENEFVTPADLFDYFSDLMRSDASLGGTYHHWLETQSALAGAESEVDERIIKTLALVALGLSGERNRVGRDLLRVASETVDDESTVRKAVDGLLSRKVLLHRKNADTVLLWHATDVDLRGRLESEKTRLFTSFDLLEHLNAFLPPEDWRPVEYNSQKRMFRFFSGYYVSADNLLSSELLTQDVKHIDIGADGVILYVVPDSEDDVDALLEALSKRSMDSRVVVLLPGTAQGMRETALDAAGIQRLLKDTSLAAEDPLVVPELQQMLDDAQGYLMRLLDKMYSPSPEGPHVIAEAKLIRIRSRREFRQFLSTQMQRVFPKTPVLNNELINKMAPSRVVKNARKKLTLGILDRYGTPDLGIYGNRPDQSMFQTLLIRTGLYFEDNDGRWRFARPDELRDENLRHVWEIVESFFTDRDSSRRKFRELFDQLQEPPIGLRSGVIPILLAAGLRAFPAAATITDPHGEYIPDIRPSTIEDIENAPDEYAIEAVLLDDPTAEYLSTLERIFSESDEPNAVETDPLRRCYDALEAWKARLPRAALVSRKFTTPVLVFQRLISEVRDPATLFLHKLFESYGKDVSDWQELTRHISEWKHELESAVIEYYDAACRSMLAALQLGSSTQVREAGKQWVNLLPENIEARLQDGVSKAIVQRFRMDYDNEEKLIDSLASLLIGKRIDDWDDSTVALFDRELRNAIRRIEDEALGSDEQGHGSSELAEGLIVARIRSLYHRLEQVSDPQTARKTISTILEED